MLFGILLGTGARFNPQFGMGTLTGDLFGWLSSSSQAFLADSGSTILANNIDIPTQLISGTTDVLFPLQQPVTTAQQINTSNPQTPVAMTWFCGGHGGCENPVNPEQDEILLQNNLKWLDQYVAGNGTPADTIPTFQWFDQEGGYYTSGLMPYDPAFNNPESLEFDGTGGLLGIVPFIGGSGPQTAASFPLSLGQAAEARNALNVSVPLAVGTKIAGAPTLSFTYTGLGTSRFLFAQLVDESTGLVVGNINTPVPVTLDGREHDVELPLEYIAYTAYDSADSLTLQITSSATSFWNFTSFGVANISDIKLLVPTVAGG
jgi:ABC-2 type transport system ATP-binding protein